MMTRIKPTGQRGAALALLLIIAGCSGNRAPPPVVAVRPAPVVVPDRPLPAAVAAGADVVWALRGGLNVAALLCRNNAITADYNLMLKQHRKLLDEAYATEQARYGSQFGSAGPARHDAAMTRLYNGFASVPDRRRFCTMATSILSEINITPSAEVARIAARALTTLEPGAMRLLNKAG